MQAEPIRTAVEDDDRVRGAVLRLLLTSQSHQLWSVAELEREIGDRVATVDAIASLHAAGLIHRCGDFVLATRAALAMDRLPL
jgi:hypothetical protein